MMSARLTSAIETAGATGMPLPQRNGRRRCAAIRTLNDGAPAPARMSACQAFPADINTSVSPYNAEPLVSGSASTSVSSARFRLIPVIRQSGTKEPKAARQQLMARAAAAYSPAAFNPHLENRR